MAYLPLSTANLPDPVIDPAQGSSPEDYFGTDVYTGTSATHERSELQFQPDFVWIKSRSDAYSSRLFDAVRGVDKVLVSDSTQAEFDGGGTTYMSSFDSDGFTLTSNISVNGTSKTFVAWNWKANGSGVSNTDGSITSAVSANTESGFSICGYTGTNANETFGHGLSQSPEVVIIKRRTNARDWVIRHPDLSDPDTKHLRFDSGAEYTASDVFRTGTNATVVSIGANSRVSADGDDYIAYCFHSVEGFSKCSSYVGNGSTDGVFIYTGFRVGWVMIKRTDSAAGWLMLDSKRDPFNVMDGQLYANSSGAESGGATADFVSNGFKIRETGGGSNASGSPYIYMAFAENPFKYSNAR